MGKTQSDKTNGDILLELLKGYEDCIYPVGTDKMGIKVSVEWWNTPYEGGINT